LALHHLHIMFIVTVQDLEGHLSKQTNIAVKQADKLDLPTLRIKLGQELPHTFLYTPPAGKEDAPFEAAVPKSRRLIDLGQWSPDCQELGSISTSTVLS